MNEISAKIAEFGTEKFEALTNKEKHDLVRVFAKEIIEKK